MLASPDGREIRDLLEKRVALITGKGGVGRSTITAALAHVAAREGKRVLVTEMGDGGDDYSALAHLFGREQLPREAAEVAPGIQGVQLLPELGVSLFLSSVLHSKLLSRTALAFEPLRRLFLATPSFREMAVFFHLLSYLRMQHKDGRPTHELILIDMPATGHTLALTALPEVILRLVTRGPIADAMREGQSYLNDPARGAAYVVTLPETLPISEALELLEGLAQTKMPQGGLFVNRMPEDLFTDEERGELARFLAAHSVFGADRFSRIIEARRVVERLDRSSPLPSTRLPEIDGDPASLVGKLADVLMPRRS